MAADIHCYCRSPLLKYHVQYGWSRHRRCLRYPMSNMLCRMLLCRMLLYEIWSLIHQIHRCRSAEWDSVNVSLPNTSVLVLLRLYRHRTHCRASLLPSSSANLTTIHVSFVVPIVPPLYRITAHTGRVSSHRRPLRLCLPRPAVSFIPVISSLTIVRMFFFARAGTTSPVSTINFYCFLFAPTFFCFSLWRPRADVASSVIVCLFCWGGIPSPTRRKYSGTFRVILSVPPYAIISLPSHHLCLLLPYFAVPH